MARILVASVPAAGHVQPLLPLARALIARGHELRWYTGQKFRGAVEASGARFVGFEHATDFDDAHFDDAFPGRSAKRGLARLKFDMVRVFIDNAPGQLRDIEAISRGWPFDVVLSEPGLIGAIFYSERTGVPCSVLGVLPMVASSVDTAPWGLGLAPGSSALHRVRNRALNALVQHVVFGEVQRHWNAIRASVGLPPTGWWMNVISRASVYMQPSIAEFEYPRRDLPANVRFIGMLPAEPPAGWVAPEFWPELDGRRPVVHVTQGTVANEKPELIAPALEGLAGEDVLVVVSTGKRAVESLGLGSLPANARVATFLSYPELLPKTAVMLTNGGYGGVQIALSHGVPLVVAGTSEDKPEVAARVAWAGAGVNLRTSTPKPHAIRRAVRTVLRDPGYRARARALARRYREHDALASAIALVEESAARRPQAWTEASCR
jgi:MGT family glycosyltransferase